MKIIITLAATLTLAITLTLTACEEKKKQDGATTTEPAAAVAEKPAENQPSGIKSVKIGNQTWMAENLNIETAGSKCYDNKPDNCKKYGRLYNWKTAMKACPSGWKLPSNAEWNKLVGFVGGEGTAGKYLKATSGWDKEGSGRQGEDKFGFSALSGGFGFNDGGFGNIYYGKWWSATENGPNFAYVWGMSSYDDQVSNDSDDRNKDDLYSVRCIKD